MAEISDKEILAVKALYHLAERNPRLRHGGTYIEDVDNYETCGKIPFAEALRVVDEMLFRFEEDEIGGREEPK